MAVPRGSGLRGDLMFGITRVNYRIDKMLIVSKGNDWCVIVGDNFTHEGNIISDYVGMVD